MNKTYTFPQALICFTHQSKDQVIESGGGKQKQQDGEEQSPEKQLQNKNSTKDKSI